MTGGERERESERERERERERGKREREREISWIKDRKFIRGSTDDQVY